MHRLNYMKGMDYVMNKQPHIILFNPDEMRWDSMGHSGNHAAATPFLDKMIQQDAVSFSNAFCQNPVCVPSRCSFFTGLYPHVNGHRTMQYLLHPGEDNLFSEARKAGYYVWMNDRNDLFAGQVPGWMESNADEIFYSYPKDEPAIIPDEIISEDKYSHFGGFLNANGQTKDDLTISAAIQRIETYQSDKPLLMFLGLMYPHCPYQVEEKYYSKIRKESLPLRIKYSQCKNKSKMINKLHELTKLEHFSEAEWNELRAMYLGMCAKVDDQFRMICEALKHAGMYDNSLIIFFSDHGDFDGDYDLTEKAQSSYEDCLTHVPFIVKPPKDSGIQPGINSALTELVDVYGTCVDYARIKPHRTYFGRSLRQNLERKDLPGRNYVFCEGGRLPSEIHCDEFHSVGGKNGPSTEMPYYPKMFAQTDDEAHAKGIMIRDHHFKYISRITDEDEFYDLRIDPEERCNLIGDEKYAEVIGKMQISLLKWLQATSDVVPFERDMRQTPEMMWNSLKKDCPLELTEEVKEMIRQGLGAAVIATYIEQYKVAQHL